MHLSRDTDRMTPLGTASGNCRAQLRQHRSAIAYAFLVALAYAARGISIEHMRSFTDEDLECMACADGSVFFGAGDEHMYISTDDGRS